MNTNKQYIIYWLCVVASITLALLTAKAVHSAIRHMEMGVWIVGGLALVGVRYGLKFLLYCKKVWTAFKFIRKYKL